MPIQSWYSLALLQASMILMAAWTASDTRLKLAMTPSPSSLIQRPLYVLIMGLWIFLFFSRMSKVFFSSLPIKAVNPTISVNLPAAGRHDGGELAGLRH
jgi:hypothetical protein